MLQAVRRLLAGNYVDEAAILARAIFEMCIQLEYMSRDPVAQAQMYIAHFDAERVRFGRVLRESDWSVGRGRTATEHQERTIEGLERDLRQKAEVESKKDIPRSWSGLTIFELARAVGAEGAYRTVYAILSSTAHTSPGALLGHVKEHGSAIVVLPGGHADMIIPVGCTALSYALRVLDLQDEELGPELAKEIVALFKDVKSASELHSRPENTPRTLNGEDG
jgi:hypothetical protein